MPEKKAKSAAAEGPLAERPLPRLLQQLFRKKFTGYLVIADATQDESQVYMRDGLLVHVRRPVDTDRLDNLLVEYGLVAPEVVARASQQVVPGTRLGQVLDRMGALDRDKLAQVLKTQLLRKLTRLFFVTEGRYAAYLDSHDYGEGDDLALMRVDPRTVIYPGIRAAYDLPRATQELSRLAGQRFRLGEVTPSFIAALGLPPHSSTVEWLRRGWVTLDDLDGITARPLEVRQIVLALYHCDLLEREPLDQAPSDSAIPQAVRPSQSSDMGFRVASDSGPAVVPEAAPAIARVGQSPVPPKNPVSSATGHAPQAASPPAAILGAGPAVSPPSQVRPNVPGESLPAIPGGRRPSGMFASPVLPSAPNRQANGPVPVAPTARGPAAAARPDAKAPSASAGAANEASLRATVQEMAQKLDRLNHFEALGVAQNASADEVSLAFVRAARQYHPDRLVSAGLHDLQPSAERILARINEAAMVLGDASRRAEYVASLAAGPRAAPANLPTVLEAENSFLKGEVFLKKGDYGRAIECFTVAAQGNPSEPQYRAYLAWARFEDPRARKDAVVRETLKVLETVMQERPRFARGHYWIGLLWKFLNEASRAERAFREAVATDAGLIEASRELRLLEMRKNKPHSGKPGDKPEPPRGGLMGKLFKK